MAKDHGSSVKDDAQYEALRKQGAALSVEVQLLFVALPTMTCAR